MNSVVTSVPSEAFKGPLLWVLLKRAIFSKRPSSMRRSTLSLSPSALVTVRCPGSEAAHAQDHIQRNESRPTFGMKIHRSP